MVSCTRHRPSLTLGPHRGAVRRSRQGNAEDGQSGGGAEVSSVAHLPLSGWGQSLWKAPFSAHTLHVQFHTHWGEPTPFWLKVELLSTFH